MTVHTIPEERVGCRCGNRTVNVTEKGGQFPGHCTACGSYVYSVPRHELGLGPRKPRSSSPETIDATQRARILLRDRGICQLCRTVEGPLHIGHLVSLADWKSRYPGAQGMEQLIGSDENLAVMCEDCNLAIGRTSVSPVMVASLHLTWLRQNPVT